jgi:hypothetical protein
MSNQDDLFAHIVEEFQSPTELREWASITYSLEDPIVKSRLSFLESNVDETKRVDVASSDVMFYSILSEFKCPTKLREWAVKVNMLNDPMIVDRIDYLEGLKKEINLFTSIKSLKNWADYSGMCQSPLVNERLIKMGYTMKECGSCGKSYNSSYIKRHICRNNECEVRCRKCNETFESRKVFYSHFMNIHHKGGAAELQDMPFDVPPWEDGQGNVIDEELKNVYDTHKSLILDTHVFGEITSIYNFPITNEFDTDTLLRQAREIYDRENQVIKLNMMFGIILKNRETNEYRFFKPYKNTEVFTNSLQIADATDLGSFSGKVSALNFNDYILAQRPNSKWIPVLVTQVRYWVNKKNFPMGGIVNLPSYIKDKKSLISLTSDHKGKINHKDNLCAFRCYTYHKHSHLYINDPKQFEQIVKHKYEKYINFTQNTNFNGLDMKDVDRVEECFEININIFIMDEKEVVTPIFKSMQRFSDTMNLNLYENHLSYIANMNVFAKKFKCVKCEELFRSQSNLKRHVATCIAATKYVYPGGFFSPSKTVFDELEEIGIYVREEDRIFEWFLVFDFEALLLKTNIKTSEKLQWSHKHVPMSVSVCSNVDGFKQPKCFVNIDTDDLLKSMVDYMYLISNTAYILAREKWSHVVEMLKDENDVQPSRKKMRRSEQTEDETLDKDDYDNFERSIRKRIAFKFETYCHQIPVLGFNSSKYDIPLIREKIATIFNLKQQSYVIKRNNAYITIAEKNLKFLDITNYLAAGSSYTKFLNAYKVEEKKSYFPYEWMDDPIKLFQTHLPEYEDFYSSLKKANVLDIDGNGRENYTQLKHIWDRLGMKTMEDFLVYYNNLDVGPFVTAVTRLQEFYFKRNIDVFKIAISLPGIARRMLFESAAKEGVHFSLFDEKNKDLYRTMKNNTIGGPSIIFTRYNKAGETMIRNSKDEVCQSIIGLDANALYLWAFDQEMPTGYFIRRKEPYFIPVVSDRYMMMYYWMDWISRKNGINIMHKMNSQKEKRIGPYFVDGFDGVNGKVFEFLGCYYHGHNCYLNKKDQDAPVKYKNTMDRLDYIKNSGFEIELIWECQFKLMRKVDNVLNDFVESKKPPFFKKYPRSVTVDKIIESVKNGTFFGAIECDIEVPHHLYEYFSEYCPIFTNSEVTFDKMGKVMQDHVRKFKLSQKPRRLLISGLKAEKILLISSLLKWYIDHGLIVTKIYQVVEYNPIRCFTSFVSQVTEARRDGDVDKSKLILADTMKLLGNSAFGSSIMNKEKHLNIQYAYNKHSASLAVNKYNFKKLTELCGGCFEIESFKKKIVFNVPTQIGYYILQYAKLKMLQFHYDGFDRMVDRSKYELMETDTDSFYYALSGKSMEDTIKPSHFDEYIRNVYQSCDDRVTPFWFLRKCCERHEKYDNRTPGLFKKEFEGVEMVALCSKTYIVSNEDGCKFSCKGINKGGLGKDLIDTYKHVLTSGESKQGDNTGIQQRGIYLFTYNQTRCGFTYFYCKREVLEDGIHTKPLNIVLKP